MIKVTGIEEAFSAIDAWLAHIEELTIKTAVALAYEALGEALVRSPQYSGDFAANWKLSAGVPDVSFQAGIFPEMTFPVGKDKQPFKRGDMAAIMHSITANSGALASAKLGETLWLSNSAEHDDLYAWKIEDNLIRFRPVNFGGEGPLGQVHGVLTSRYSEITKSNIDEIGKLK